MLRLRKILLCDYLYYILLLFSFIFLIVYFSNYEVKKIYNELDNYFELRIKKYVVNGNHLTLEFDNLIGNYYFKTYEEKTSFINNYSLNDLVILKGVLSKPNNNTIPNIFNYKEYLSHKNIEYILNIEEINIKKKNKNILYIIKNYIYKRINNINDNSYLFAFVLGESKYIDKDIYDNYKTNGITHLFALSGLHISVFSSIFLFVLKKIKCNEILSFIITSLFLLFFSFIASFTSSILRATIFFILSNINKIWYFFIKPKYLLYLTFIILVIINPNYIYNTGFILSFTITFFILIYQENNSKKSLFRISMISFLASMPIIINMSYEINVLGFLNNLFFIPYVSNIVFPLSLLTIIFSKLISILTMFLKFMEVVSYFSSKLLNITISFSKISKFEIILFYFFLILIVKNRRYFKFFLLILIIFLYIKPYLIRNTNIYYIDVGQGDNSLIVTKNNKSVLIDSGGKIDYYEEEWKKKNHSFNLMNDSIVHFYKSIGIKKIDYVIFTHGDYDHMGYAKDLINNINVEKVIFNCGSINELETDLIKILDSKKIQYYFCIEEISIDGIKLSFLKTKEYNNENDNSSVIYTEINGYKFLFMGDAGVNKEKDILENYNIRNIDVLKVGHHGSKTSSSKEFINAMNPKYSVISVGKNNKYGHPDKEVLNNLKESKIYRTDQDGSIMFKINNNKLKIETCSP